MRRSGLIVLMALLAAVACQPVKKGTPQPWIPNHPGLPPVVVDGPPPAGSPTLSSPEVVVGNLSTPWDIAFGPSGEMFFDERRGSVKVLLPGAPAPNAVFQPHDLFHTDVFFGLLGLDVHPKFATNRFLYVCYTTLNDIRVVRWTVSMAFDAATNPTPIVTGIPVAIAPNLGCRVKFAPDGALWITTGDVHGPGVPQDRNSLGGKFLRVPNGEPSGNPAALVVSYGHRNPQGIAFHPVSGQAYGIEHGTNRDDEVNRLVVAGSNGGWDPQPPPYNENVPMTDLVKFPNAMLPVWRSGDAGPPPNSTTIAPSGGTFLDHPNWGAWDGALAVATLKGRHLRVMFLNDSGVVESTTSVLREHNTRLRTAVQGPDGSLYIATDAANGGGAIWKITPTP
jgi:glucose/arabinose dehydrogenase